MLSVLLAVTGAAAGALGALLGIGGGIVLVPTLVIALGLPMSEAVPASLMCVVATSCGAAANYVEHRLADVRLALSLELATISGAIAGGFVAALLAQAWLAVVFGVFVMLSATQLLRARPLVPASNASGVCEPQNYAVGVSGSFVAGSLSAMLGIGGGPLKVPLMVFGMRVPFKVAAATSNLMLGVTASASVVGYAARGHLKLSLVAPLVVGVLLGAAVGSRLSVYVPARFLKRLFAVVLVLVGIQMLWRGGAALWIQG